MDDVHNPYENKEDVMEEDVQCGNDETILME